jgi:hypothetical protein
MVDPTEPTTPPSSPPNVIEYRRIEPPKLKANWDRTFGNYLVIALAIVMGLMAWNDPGFVGWLILAFATLMFSAAAFELATGRRLFHRKE